MGYDKVSNAYVIWDGKKYIKTRHVDFNEKEFKINYKEDISQVEDVLEKDLDVNLVKFNRIKGTQKLAQNNSQKGPTTPNRFAIVPTESNFGSTGLGKK